MVDALIPISDVPAFLSGPQYRALPREPQPWIIKHFITAGGLTNLYGKPKGGKSLTALGMAHAISTGQHTYLGLPVLKHGPVAYLQIDTPRDEHSKRLDEMTFAGFDDSGIFTCDMRMCPYPFNILENHGWLKKQLDLVKPIVVFVDTIREAHGSDENDSTAMRNVMTLLVAACRPAAIVIISHSRKDSVFTSTNGADLMSDARGSSYIAGRMDCVVRCNTDGHKQVNIMYQGRGSGKDTILTTQHGDQEREIPGDLPGGWVVLDGKEAKYWEVLKETVEAMTPANAKVKVSPIAEAVEAKLQALAGAPPAKPYKKKSQITKDINHHLKEVGIARVMQSKKSL